MSKHHGCAYKGITFDRRLNPLLTFAALCYGVPLSKNAANISHAFVGWRKNGNRCFQVCFKKKSLQGICQVARNIHMQTNANTFVMWEVN